MLDRLLGILIQKFAPLVAALPPDAKIERGTCANRQWCKVITGATEITVVIRDLTKPDGYGQEEVEQMRGVVARAEAERVETRATQDGSLG